MVTVWKSEPYYNILIISWGYNPLYHTQEEEYTGLSDFQNRNYLWYVLGFVLDVAKAKI